MSASTRSQQSSVQTDMESGTYNDVTLNLISQLTKKDSQVSGLGRDYWLDDSSATKCRACDRKFNTFRRRHHCRICGKIFCSSCTTFMDGEKFNHNGRMRVCLSCLKLADRIVDYVSSEDESIIDDSSSVLHRVRTSDTTSPSKADVHDPTALSETSMSVNSPTHSDQLPQNTPHYAHAPTPPPMMTIAATRKGESVEIDLGRTNSLTRKNRANTFNRPQMNNDLLHYSPRPSIAPQLTTTSTNSIFTNTNLGGATQEDSRTIFDSFNLGTAAAAASSLFNFGTPQNHHIHQHSMGYNGLQHSNTNFSTTNNGYYQQQQQHLSPYKNQPQHNFKSPNSQIGGSYNGSLANHNIPQMAHSNSALSTNTLASHQNNFTHLPNQFNRHGFSNPLSTSLANINHILPSRNPSNFIFGSDTQLNSHSHITPNNNSTSNFARFQGEASPDHPIGSGNDDDDDDDDEEEQTMLAFNSESMDSLDNLHLTWDTAKLPASSIKFENILHNNNPANILHDNITEVNNAPNTSATITHNTNGNRRAFRSASNRRFNKFQRLKTRRMSKSGTSRLLSDSIFNNNRINSQNFGLDDTFEFMDDFLRAGENHARQLLKQSLSDREVEHFDLWEDVLFKVLKKVSNISIDLSAGNSFDISTYLKIKKIPGASIADTNLVDGIVFSKVLALKTMRREISNPKIMLISFPLEYELESDNRISTIEPIIAQQKQYLEKLVARIIALHPDIVLLSNSINGIALNLLDQAGIAVAYYVKPTIIERMSRMANADIITSIDKLATNPKLGKCKDFKAKSFLFEGIVRSYLFFTGCNEDGGYTVLLRGASKDKLQYVKHCATLMLYILYNNKLEAGLMRDQCLQASEYTIPTEMPAPLGSISMNSHKDFIPVFEKRLLSSSPWVKFEIPFILTKLKKYEDQLQVVKQSYADFEAEVERIKKSLQIQESPTEEKNIGEDFDEKQLIRSDAKKLDYEILSKFLNDWGINLEFENLPGGFSELQNMVKTAFNYKEEFLLSEVATAKRQWEQFWLTRKLAFFDPMAHQNIVTLFSMVSTKNATPCAGPDIQVTDYYWENDFSLGQFIEHICLHVNDVCTEGCNLTMKEHFRSYVHGSGKVDVVIENNMPSVGAMEDIITSWSYCKQCYNSTPALPLSDNAWKYSFGKYLELSFWCRGMRVKGATCPHDFYRDQIHYFSFQNLAVRVEYTEIQLLDLSPPKFKLFWKPEINIKIKLDTYNSALKKAELFFDSIRSRLNRVKVDSMTYDKMEAGQKRIEELKKQVEKEHNDIKLLADDIYSKTAVTDHLSLNAIIRTIQELSGDWNAEFMDFDQNYLPTEKEIKKITAFQLDRLFRASSESKINDSNSKNITEKSDETKNQTEKDLNIDDEKIAVLPDNSIRSTPQEKRSDELDDDILNNPIAHGSPVSLQTRKPGQWIQDKISELESEQKKDSSISISPTKMKFNPLESRDIAYLDRKTLWESRSKELQDHILNADADMIPKLDDLASDNKVKKLTEYFDAQEFFRQREEEKQKLQASAYRPKVANMKPTAEIYKSINDVVDEGRGNSQANKQINSEDESTGTPQTDDGEDNDDSHAAQQTAPSTSASNNNTTKGAPNDKQELLQPEKTSLLKSLTHFWADRSSTLWEPLAYPLNSTEHIFVDSDVLVREDEPSSIIAFCLNTSDYSAKLHELNSQTNKQQASAGVGNASTMGENDSTFEAPHPAAANGDNVELISLETSRNGQENQTTNNNDEYQGPNLEEFILKKGFHLKYQFEEGYSTISCKIFFAEQFDALRKQCGIDSNFIQSLSRCVKWDSTGGKSGSAFLKTLDDRFIIKELSRTELESFVQLATSYFEYFAQALFHGLPTVLVKIFGVYQIQVKNSMVGSKSYTLDILIMENLFYDRKTTRIFDLKGSMRNRHVEQTGKENEVLLDENMVEYIYESPLFVRENAKRLLRASLWNDTLFLAKLNVMDYSLVIGIDSENSELVVGIIDCIRTFTWDKKLESWVKEKGLVGGTGVGKEPTVITPKQYKNRFREAMERYILMAPGPWHQGN